MLYYSAFVGLDLLSVFICQFLLFNRKKHICTSESCYVNPNLNYNQAVCLSLQEASDNRFMAVTLREKVPEILTQADPCLLCLVCSLFLPWRHYPGEIKQIITYYLIVYKT